MIDQSATHMRWMIRRDIPEVLGIEQASFADPWTEAEFIQQLRRCNVIGTVAETSGRVVGYMIYELHNRRLELVRFAVAVDVRGQGYGSRLLLKLKDKIQESRRSAIGCMVPEASVKTQVWLRSHNFRALSVEDDYFGNGKGAIRFVLPECDVA